MNDSGFQMNLDKRNDILPFYWEKTNERGIAIEGSPVNLLGKVANFPISIVG